MKIPERISKILTTLSVAETVKAVAAELQGKFGVEVEVVESLDGVQNEQARKALAAGKAVKGWYELSTGKVVIYAPNAESAQDVMAMYAHEVVAHKGMRGLLGEKRYNKLCQRLGAALTPEQRGLVEEYEGSDADVLGDEYVARIAEMLIDEKGEIKEPTTWEKVKGAVREFFRDVLGLELTDADIRYMLWRSGERLRRSKADVMTRARDVVTGEKLNDDAVRMRQEEADYQREIREITERAKTDGTFMKAPDGNPSNLDERQWTHVRTTRFKKWFGDWELRHKVVNIVTGRIDHGFKNFAEARKWAKDNLVRVYSNEETGGKGEIHISGRAVDKFLSDSSISKSDNKDVHLAVLKSLPDVLHESIDAEQHPDRKKGADGTRDKANGLNSTDIIHRLFGAVKIGGKIYRVKTTVKEIVRQNGEKAVHSYEATEIELLAGQTEKGVPFSRNSNNSISAANLLQGIESANDPGTLLLESHSKAVDENGEPKVFYHNTNAEFTIFDSQRNGSGTDAGWLGDGFYFYGDENEGRGYGKHKMAVFLNVRNPYYATPEENNRLAEANERDSSIAFREEIESDGYDGVYYNGDLRQEGVVFYPNQIKSATDNIGTYDANNDDIRFAIGKKRKDDMRRGLLNKLANATEEQVEQTITEIEKLGEQSKAGGDVKVEKAALHWVKQGTIVLPEDDYKVIAAVKMATDKGIDITQYDSPMRLINENTSWKKRKDMADPDKVATLRGKRALGNTGITIYDVEDSEQGQRDMRMLWNGTWGEERECPWCLLHDDGHGGVSSRAKSYWFNTYTAYQKRVAFKDGRPIAFFADEEGKEPHWWDLNDRSHEGIPVEGKIPASVTSKQLGMENDGTLSGLIEYDEDGNPHGKITNVHRGDKQNGAYERYCNILTDEGERLLVEQAHYKDGKLNGKRTTWHGVDVDELDGPGDIGLPFETEYYIDGNLEGHRSEWNKFGGHEEENWRNGKQHGVRLTYMSEKELSRMSIYDGGEEKCCVVFNTYSQTLAYMRTEDTISDFDEKGNLYATSSFASDVQWYLYKPEWRYAWNDDGSLHYASLYVEGKLHQEYYFNPDVYDVHEGKSAEKNLTRDEREKILSAAEKKRAEVLAEAKRLENIAKEEEYKNATASEERDEYGNRFMLSSDGSTDFGQITAETGLKPAPIRLSEGMVTDPSSGTGYGLAHTEARHGDEIRENGFSSVQEFVEYVGKNYNRIQEGVVRQSKDGNNLLTYLVQLTDEHNNTLFVELSSNGEYWSVNSAGVFNKARHLAMPGFTFYAVLQLIHNQVLACHLLGLLQAHDMENTGRHVGQNAVLHLCRLIIGHIDKRHGVERMGRVGRTIVVNGVVGITVVGNDNSLVARLLDCLDNLAHAGIYCHNGFLNGLINTRMTHHVAVGKVDNNEIVLVLADGCHQLVFHLIGTHLGLEVVGCNFGRRHQDAIFSLIGLLAPTVEEERNVGILLGLGRVHLAQALR